MKRRPDPLMWYDGLNSLSRWERRRRRERLQWVMLVVMALLLAWMFMSRI